MLVSPKSHMLIVRKRIQSGLKSQRAIPIRLLYLTAITEAAVERTCRETQKFRV